MVSYFITYSDGHIIKFEEGRSLYGLVANVLYCNIVVSYKVYCWTNVLGKDMNLLSPSCGSNDYYLFLL